jgi:hypothetical protein
VLTERLTVRWRALPPWAQAILVMLACELVTAVVLDRAARFAVLNQDGRVGSLPYQGFVVRWDSDWYRKIAQFGYPTLVPHRPDGVVAQSAWAFYPLYPFAARLLMSLGIAWPYAPLLVSFGSALASAVLLRSVVAHVVGPAVALWSVALLGSFPTAPVLQLAYSEALALALLLAVLRCLQQGQYWWAVVATTALGLTRPIAAPLALVVLVHVVRRWRRGPRPAMAALVLAAGVATVLWPVIVAVRTGDLHTYADTMAAWRPGAMRPLYPWWARSGHYLGPVLGRVLVLEVPVVLIWLLTRPLARRLGAELRVWTVAYLAYLYLVLDPTTSLFRYLLLFFPLGVLLLVASPSSAYRRALVVASFGLQVVWVVTIWRTAFGPP